MRFLYFAAVSLCLSTPALHAEPSKTRYFADGLQIEAKLEIDGETSRFSVTRYDDTMDSDESLYGDITSEGGGVYRFEQKWTDDQEKEHVRTGKVTVKGGALSYAGMKETGGAKDGEDGRNIPAAGGPWKEITAATVLKNAKTRYETADKRLNEAWKKAKEEAGEKGLAALQKGQRDWIEYRDSMTERITWDAVRATSGAEDPDSVDFKALPEYWRQLTYYTVERTPILLAWSGKNVTPGKAGVYVDSFGGTVTIKEKEKDGGVDFEINVVRGPTFHLGEISGTAKLKGDTATWTDAEKPEGEKAAVVRLKFNADKSLTVETENAESYHGARAYFDAQYFKTATAEKKAK